MAMNGDVGSRGGSQNISTSDGGDYYPLVDELVDADDAAFTSLSGKLTKEWLLFVLKDTVSQLKKTLSHIDNIDVTSKQINSVNDRVIENNQVIIDTRDKISELSELKTKVDTFCAKSNVKMSSSSRTF